MLHEVLEMSTAFSDACIHPARFLCHENRSPDDILSICLTQEIREMYHKKHSVKLGKNEMPGSVRQ
jgi:hypothetical protein